MEEDEDDESAASAEEESASAKAAREAEERRQSAVWRELEEQAAKKAAIKEVEQRRFEEENFGRLWTDISGGHTLRAELEDFHDGKAGLRKYDRTIVYVPSVKLSVADQTYIREEMKRRRPTVHPTVNGREAKNTR